MTKDLYCFKLFHPHDLVLNQLLPFISLFATFVMKSIPPFTQNKVLHCLCLQIKEQEMGQLLHKGKRIRVWWEISMAIKSVCILISAGSLMSHPKLRTRNEQLALKV